MKRIILSSLVILGLVGGVAAATRAYFFDTEEVLGNTFTAGKLDLELGAGNPIPFSVTNLAPGDTDIGMVTLTNTAGSLDGHLDVKLTNLVEAENGCVEPETEAHDPNCSATAGDLGLDSLLMAIFVDVNQDGVWNNGDIKLAYNSQVIPYSVQNYLSYSTPRNLVDTKGSWNDIMTLTQGQSVDLVIDWRVKTTWDYPNYNQNIIQTDSLGFDVLTSLEQVGGTGGVVE